MGQAQRDSMRIKQKAIASAVLGVSRHLKAREVAAIIRDRHPELRGRSKWRTIGAFCRRFC